MRCIRGCIVFLSLSSLAACRDVVSDTQRGRLEARWTGADTAGISAPAVAEWCDELRLLQISAVSGDTGVALAIYPGVVLSPDTYQVVMPAQADSAKPSARVALRWFGKTEISGFQGDSGSVILERTDSGELSGKVSARASSVSNNQRVRITGTFHQLDMFSESRACQRETASDTPAMEAGIDPEDID